MNRGTYRVHYLFFSLDNGRFDGPDLLPVLTDDEGTPRECNCGVGLHFNLRVTMPGQGTLLILIPFKCSIFSTSGKPVERPEALQ